MPHLELYIHFLHLFYDTFYVGDYTGGVDMILGYTVPCERLCAFVTVSFPPRSHFPLVIVCQYQGSVLTTINILFYESRTPLYCGVISRNYSGRTTVVQDDKKARASCVYSLEPNTMDRFRAHVHAAVST